MSLKHSPPHSLDLVPSDGGVGNLGNLPAEPGPFARGSIKEVTVSPLTLPASIELLTRKIDRKALADEDWARIADKWVVDFRWPWNY
ncbi:MAG: hypothetical protein R3B74_17640 [Nitrospirales bacterium]|nr:hypothetical protein [Nitrospirales bacterium]